MEYIKHFNRQSEGYLSYRPDYPDALFDFLVTLVPKNASVWDCGTGNDQAAQALASRFSQICATDINLSPLTVGSKSNTVNYMCCLAEKSCFADNSFHLITVAQALHWFNLPDFYNEVRRVGGTSSVFASWCYSLCSINPSIDHLVSKLYTEILGDKFWPKERRYIDEKYQTISFPFEKFATPTFTIDKTFSFSMFLGYLNTWSAVKEYQDRMGANPINIISKELEEAWVDENHQVL